MRSTRFLLLVVAALLMGAASLPMPTDASDDAPDVPALVADPSPAIPAVVAPAEPPAPAPAVAVAQAASDPLAALDVGQLAQLVQSPYGILLVAVGLVYLLFEIAKGLWLGLATAPPARKRAIALLLGATVGGLLSLAGPVAWWIGLVAGALGAVVPVAGRALGTGLRTSGGGGAAMLAVCVLAGGLAAGGVACSAADRAGWRAFGVQTATCLQERCGVAGEVIGAMQSGGWGDLGSKDNLLCALACLGSGVYGGVQVGQATATQTARWYGTSDEVQRETVYRVRIVRDQ